VLCQAGKKQQQQQPIDNKATQGPPDIMNQMEDMEDVIMIDEDEDDEVGAATVTAMPGHDMHKLLWTHQDKHNIGSCTF
jgi:hypothetical protein